MPLSVFAATTDSPERVALVTDDASLTFADLARGVRRAVGWLRDRDLAGADPVGLVARADLPTLEMVHALLALGTPALLLHPRLTAPEREALVAAARPAGMVDPGWREKPVRLKPDAPAGEPTAPPADERPLAVVHTSGTTGTPRGVVLSRRAFAASAAASAANLGWRDDDRWLLPLPIAHVGGLSIVTRCLLARRAVVLAPGTEPAALLAAVRRHRVTLVSVVPTLLDRLLRAAPGGPPDHLRAVLLGGAAASPDLLEEAADRGWPVLTTYGLTETCSQATTQPFGTVNRGELGSGRPLPGVELRIGDDEAIQVRGPTLFSGYLPPGQDSPFLDNGWFPTGDRGRLDDRGNLHVLGRRSDRIVTGGENVDPVEVERALEQLPGVARACVFAVAHDEWGEQVCAALVPTDGAGGPTGLDAAEALAALRPELERLRSVLAGFKLPRQVAVLDALPLNPTGKVDRKETARRAGPRLRPL